jgi:hypothetical protein
LASNKPQIVSVQESRIIVAPPKPVNTTHK